MDNKVTDLDSLKSLAKEFLELPPQKNKLIPFLVYHPFFETDYIPTEKILENGEKELGFASIFNAPEEFEKAKERIRKEIDNGDTNIIFLRIVKSYRLTFLKHAKSFMSKDDFEKMLVELWICSENPNQDNNVSINDFIKWFSNADKRNLMKQKELDYYNALPDVVHIYRGVAVGRAEEKGLSWTCNFDTAKWFSERFNHDNKKGYILKGTIKKTDIFAYLNGRGEDEILCNSRKVYDLERLDNYERF